MSRALAVAGGLALAFELVACGPPRATSADETGTSDDSTTEPETDSGAPEETGDDPSGPEPTGFVPDSDSRVSECDPWQQDCDEGEKCVPYASSGGHWDANKCVPVTGSQATGEPCSYTGAAEATDDCDATGVCWHVEEIDGQLIGECAQFCSGTPDSPSCPSGHHCPLASDGSITLCQPTCDPLVQDCQEGMGCFWVNSTFDCVFTTQDIQPGQPCGFINDCAAGLACFPADVVPNCAGLACCTPYCELGRGDGPCEAVPGSVCEPFFIDGTAPPDYAQVGTCQIPNP